MHRLLDYDNGVNITPNILTTALRHASHEDKLQVAQLLVEYGADINPHATASTQGTALQEAGCCGHVNLVEFLLHSGADVNACVYASEITQVAQVALVSAAAGDQLEIVRLLLKHGADVTK